MENLFDIKGKVVVMTGACGVLGATIVKYLAAQGAKVALLDLDRAAEKGEGIVAEIKAEGGESCFLIFDLDVEAVRKVVDLNLFGTILPTMVFAKAMVGKKKGSIINFCSETSLRPLTRVAGYGVAKAAVANWTKYLAGELAIKFGEGFRVNAIAPGFLLTNQNRSLLTNPDGSLTDRSHKILAHTPFGRFLEPEELLGTLHWLASDASKAVTGTINVVDGGFDAFSI